jgi:[methyl-Co(III) methanol-specific corrinoid protein]:coenzyme M methyltransferase
MNDEMMKLMNKYKKGNRPVFNLGPFLPIIRMKELGLEFNRILQNSRDMTNVLRLDYELGFEAAVLPFDLNIEAEILGAEVTYHDGYDGIPVYPTVTKKCVTKAEDILIPERLSEAGRLPVVLECLDNIKKTSGRGAIGVFVPGPFTLAGQVADLDELFVMTIRQPDTAQGIFRRLAEFIIRLRDVYVEAGVDFITIEDGGATAISPRMFRRLLLPHLKEVFTGRKIPQALSLTGKAEKYIEFLLECEPDAIGIDQESDIERCRTLVPDDIPLLAVAGDYTMLAEAGPAEVRAAVWRALDQGVYTVLPPADIYPPAKMENILAFVAAVREYQG